MNIGGLSDDSKLDILKGIADAQNANSFLRLPYPNGHELKAMSKKQKRTSHDRPVVPRSQPAIGLVSGIVGKGPFWNKMAKAVAEKVILLGKENLEKLRGYKAYVDLRSNGELHLTITGLSPESGRILFNELEKMKDEEVHGA